MKSRRISGKFSWRLSERYFPPSLWSGFFPPHLLTTARTLLTTAQT
jgi:hypothetical protein